jgi:hypothetical protein
MDNNFFIFIPGINFIVNRQGIQYEYKMFLIGKGGHGLQLKRVYENHDRL